MAKRIIKDYDNVSVDVEGLEGHLDFDKFFDRSAPLHLEIGSGKGTFLVNQAQAQKDVNFLGIEWARKYYRLAVDRIGRWGLGNVRLMRTDAAFFIRDHVADESFDMIHIYFPDPWPKARHNKRRFFQQSNLDEMYRCLKPNGVIQFATDHADYFAQASEILPKNTETFEEIEFTRAADAKEGEVVGTNYERKYVMVGKPIYKFAIRKRLLENT